MILNSLPKPSNATEIWWIGAAAKHMLWFAGDPGMSRARSTPCVMIAADLMAVQLRKQTSAETPAWFLGHRECPVAGGWHLVLVLMPKIGAPQTTKPLCCRKASRARAPTIIGLVSKATFWRPTASGLQNGCRPVLKTTLFRGLRSILSDPCGSIGREGRNRRAVNTMTSTSRPPAAARRLELIQTADLVSPEHSEHRQPRHQHGGTWPADRAQFRLGDRLPEGISTPARRRSHRS